MLPCKKTSWYREESSRYQEELGGGDAQKGDAMVVFDEEVDL